MSTKQITIDEICQYITDKYMAGRRFEEVNWDDIDNRLGRFYISDEQERELRLKLFDEHNKLPRADDGQEDNKSCAQEAIVLKPWRYSY